MTIVIDSLLGDSIGAKTFLPLNLYLKQMEKWELEFLIQRLHWM